MSFKQDSAKSTIIILSIVCFSPIGFGQILRNEHDFMTALKYSKEKTVPSAAENLERITNEVVYSKSSIADRAKQILKEGLLGSGYDVSSLCLNHTEILLEGLATTQNWALRIIDAMGKPPSELMNFHITWLGSYDECVAIEAKVNRSGRVISPFTGRYCTASFPLGPGGQATLFSAGGPALTIGVCVPNSCSAEDTTDLVNTVLSLLRLNTSILVPQVSCQLESIDYDAKAIVVITICSIFALIMVVATVYDIMIVLYLNTTPNDGLPKYERIKHEDENIVQNGIGKHYGATDSLTASEQNDYATNNVKSDNRQNTVIEKRMETKGTYKTGTLGKVLLSFSIYTNASKILNVNQPAGTLTAVNGIRFISMTWVVLGHTYAFGLGMAENSATFLPAVLKRFTFQVISNATVCVDTFFTLSGLLVAYLTLKEIKKRYGALHFNWGMFYFHRFWRLTPPYMLFLMFYVPLAKYWSNGPVWPQKGFEIDECENSWWKNLLYVNNLIKPEKMCMAWSWYLANDMQFYVISPLMLIPLFYSSLLGFLVCGALIVICFVTVGIISRGDKLGPSLLNENAGEFFDDIYVKPWCRIGPYVIGIFAGYILYKTECKIKISKIYNLLGWAVSTAIALSVLYGLYDSSGSPQLSLGVSALYNATNRTAWAIAVSWVVIVCATGNGGWINTLLSWKGIIPLSRLTYCAYLVHPVVMYLYYYSRRTLIHFSDLELAWLFCGHLCITFGAAFILSLTFESPMMGLEKVLLGRSKSS